MISRTSEDDIYSFPRSSLFFCSKVINSDSCHSTSAFSSLMILQKSDARYLSKTYYCNKKFTGLLMNSQFVPRLSCVSLATGAINYPRCTVCTVQSDPLLLDCTIPKIESETSEVGVLELQYRTAILGAPAAASLVVQ